MKVIRITTRVYVDKLDLDLPFYQNLLGKKVDMRFTYPEVGLEFAAVGEFLLFAGSKDTKATFLVDSLEEFKSYLEAKSGSKKNIREILN